MYRSRRMLSNFWKKDQKLKKIPYTANDYIPTPKNIQDDFLLSFDQNEHYNEKEEEEKRNLKTKMISHQRRKMDKLKGNLAENFTT